MSQVHDSDYEVEAQARLIWSQGPSTAAVFHSAEPDRIGSSVDATTVPELANAMSKHFCDMLLGLGVRLV